MKNQNCRIEESRVKSYDHKSLAFTRFIEAYLEFTFEAVAR